MGDTELAVIAAQQEGLVTRPQACDGWQYHRLPTDLDRAAARNNALELAGWRMLHFTAGSGAARIVADVAAARERSLRANTPHEGQWRESEVG